MKNGIAARVLLMLSVCSTLCSAASTSASKFLEKPLTWFASDDARGKGDNILSYQCTLGGWPKNMDTAAKKFAGDVKELHPTFDNSATTDELRYLARLVDATHDAKYKDAFLAGLDYLLKAQYANGGWPQSYPPNETNYDQYITFNDGAMVRLMFLVREIGSTQSSYVADDQTRVENIYGFVDEPRKQQCRDAWNKAVDCLLKTQITENGQLTAWCQQYDENTLEPRGARTFELPCITPCDSVGICHALMVIERPSPAVIASVDAAVAWMDRVKIPGIRVEDRKTPGTPRGFERFVVKDPDAPPMWARFYQIGTDRPFFAGRDSVMRFDLSEIEIERRTGYNWMKYWPKNLIAEEYPAWQKRIAAAATQPATRAAE